jgi:hypothetical protein
MNGRSLLAPPERHQDCCCYIIRFVPSLNLAVLKARPREDKQLLLWYCLRAIDTTGRGVLDHGLAIHILKTAFGYQRQTLYKHLDKGDGVYWRKHTTRKGRAIIILQGLLRVARHLEVHIRGRERFLELPASGLPPSGQMQARRALLYNTGAYKPLSADVNHPVSRKSLEEKTGIQARQQRRYDQVMDAQGPVREPTFAYYRDEGTFTLKSLVRLVETERGVVLTRQLPNCYGTWYPGSSRGMLPKVARMLGVGDQSFIRGEATFTTNRDRRYYRGFKFFLRAALRGKATEGFYPSRANSRKYVLGAIW